MYGLPSARVEQISCQQICRSSSKSKILQIRFQVLEDCETTDGKEAFGTEAGELDLCSCLQHVRSKTS